MSNRPQTVPSQPSIGRVTRSATGRTSGAFGRLFGNRPLMQATARFLGRQLWVWPIVAAILIGGVGWWVNRAVEGAMREQRANDLKVMVNTSVNALRVWMGEQKINVERLPRTGDSDLSSWNCFA